MREYPLSEAHGMDEGVCMDTTMFLSSRVPKETVPIDNRVKCYHYNGPHRS